MFYANNEQVKGIFLNGRNYNYLSYGFGKIIPEDRSAEQLNLNLAGKHLNKYIVEFGTVKDGYDNALVSPRFDKPDSNGIFHTPFTYYYNDNIISTKEVPVLITNGEFALSNALVYNDMNINGAINYFAINTDFLGHNVNVFPENDNYQSAPLLYYEMLNNCSNFDLNINTRFSKSGYPTLYNCNNFSGNFRYVGNQDREYPGFMGFLEDCKDGVFNIDCTNMHGGGRSANITNYYNFSCISNCNNIRLNINGSPWQAWVHPSCYSGNCNITTFYIVPGFDHMNHCNFNLYIPRDANKVEKSAYYSILSNSYNCNVYFDGTNSNLYSFRNNNFSLMLFEDLNNCNLNLLLNNSTGIDFSHGNRLNNCNIQFNHMNIAEQVYLCWGYMNNCNITGDVINAEYSGIDLVSHSTNVNLNVNASLTNNLSLLWDTSNINGNAILGNAAYVRHSNYLNLNVSGGSLSPINVEHSIFNSNGTNIYATNLNNCKFKIYNCNDFAANNIRNSYIRANNTLFSILRANDTEIQSEGSNVSILGADNCYNLTLSGLTFNTPDSDSLFENIYNSNLKFGTVNPYYRLWRVANCSIDGFPRALTYVENSIFRPFNMRYVGLSSSGVGTWSNVWPHRKLAGINSTGSISRCRIDAAGWGLDGSIAFNNVNNMQTSFGTFYNGTVTANLPIYNMNIKLNVDCSTLNLGIFQAGPPHGFQNATISANDIYAKGDIPSAYVQVNCDTKIYCENYCSVCFSPYVSNINSVLQPVILINNYDHYNSGNQSFFGGLTRIGSLSTRTGPSSLNLYSGAFVFINNAVLARSYVKENSVLFLGSNVTWANDITVESGGLIVNKENWGSHASEIQSRIGRGHLAWNVWDTGPWGSRSLFDYCTNV